CARDAWGTGFDYW
nr:immunoglobulin heavy chain junction region [Macaca mulatta]MOV51887.1 immunoglobulin heavy chain junction region [Macaca mulatta]MOV52445.1 immunoglobulin heavy chain junction region [Macaca mulatta]MOV52447.1 immunoglobulin heavy chain junction region [Macaca mulatta]MOV52727.1 immunoglobulin heavy chain junction region [Macaca mulatta]